MAINLRGVNQFLVFDHESFLSGKEFEACRAPEVLADYNTGEVLGAKVEAEIASDTTPYYGKGNQIDNVGARITIKMLGKRPEDYQWAGRRVPIRIGNVTRSSLWAVAEGRPRNQLTLEADIFPVNEESGDGRKK